MEKDLSYDPFTREERAYQEEGRLSGSTIETAIPWTFILLYTAMTVAALST